MLQLSCLSFALGGLSGDAAVILKIYLFNVFMFVLEYMYIITCIYVPEEARSPGA